MCNKKKNNKKKKKKKKGCVAGMFLVVSATNSKIA